MAKTQFTAYSGLQALRADKENHQWRPRFFRAYAERIYCWHFLIVNGREKRGSGHVWHKAFGGSSFNFTYKYAIVGKFFFCHFYFKGMLICEIIMTMPKSNLAMAIAKACGKYHRRLAYAKNKKAIGFKEFWQEVKIMRQVVRNGY